MSSNGLIEQLFRRYSGIVDFIGVYITEAHAKNEWPVGSTWSSNDQPCAIQERLTLAKQFQQTYKPLFPMICDTMENTFCRTFAAWPFRFYVVHQGKLVLKAQPDKSSCNYNLQDMELWLEQYQQSL